VKSRAFSGERPQQTDSTFTNDSLRGEIVCLGGGAGCGCAGPSDWGEEFQQVVAERLGIRLDYRNPGRPRKR